MPYFVYILFSEKLQRFYTGTTDSVEKRLTEHNSSRYAKSSTVKGTPWQLYFSIECPSSSVAYALEKYIKRMKSSVFIRKLKTNEALLKGILQKLSTNE